jgi:hypothetical protein
VVLRAFLNDFLDEILANFVENAIGVAKEIILQHFILRPTDRMIHVKIQEYGTELMTHGAGSPDRRLSSIAFLSAAKIQKVSNAMVGRRGMPETITWPVLTQVRDFLFFLFESPLAVEGSENTVGEVSREFDSRPE